MSNNKSNATTTSSQPSQSPTASTVTVPPVTVGRRDGGSSENIERR